MDRLTIEGGKKLSGYIEVDGAKNAVLPILAATVLVPGLCVIENVPDLKDVTMTLDILSAIGCKINRVGSTVFVDSKEIICYQVPNMLAAEIRSSITFLGALLARCGEVSICYPGGCVKNLTKAEAELANALTFMNLIYEFPMVVQKQVPQTGLHSGGLDLHNTKPLILTF